MSDADCHTESDKVKPTHASAVCAVLEASFSSILHIVLALTLYCPPSASPFAALPLCALPWQLSLTVLQVVTVYRLLELLPAVVTAAFTQQELAAAAAAQQAMTLPVEQQHQQLLQQFDDHKKALQPSMAQPSR